MEQAERQNLERIASASVEFLDAYKAFYDQVRGTTEILPEASKAVMNLARAARDANLFSRDSNAERNTPVQVDDTQLTKIGDLALQVVEQVSAEIEQDYSSSLAAMVQSVSDKNVRDGNESLDSVFVNLGRIEKAFVEIGVTTPQSDEIYGRYMLQEALQNLDEDGRTQSQIDALQAVGKRDELEQIADASIRYLNAAYRTGMLDDLARASDTDELARERLDATRSLSNSLKAAGYRVPETNEDTAYDFITQSPKASLESLMLVNNSARAVTQAFGDDTTGYVTSFSWSKVALANLSDATRQLETDEPVRFNKTDAQIAIALASAMECADVAMTLTARASQDTSSLVDFTAPDIDDRRVSLPGSIGGMRTGTLLKEVVARTDRASTMTVLDIAEKVNAGTLDERNVPESIVKVANRMSPDQLYWTIKTLDAMQEFQEATKIQGHSQVGDFGNKPVNAKVEKALQMPDERGYVVSEGALKKLDDAVGMMISTQAYSRLSELSSRLPGAAALEGTRHERVFAHEEQTVKEATEMNEAAHLNAQELRIMSGRSVQVMGRLVDMEMNAGQYSRLPPRAQNAINIFDARPGRSSFFKDYDGISAGANLAGQDVYSARNKVVNHIKDVLGENSDRSEKLKETLLAIEGRPIVANTKAEAEGVRIMSHRLIQQEIATKQIAAPAQPKESDERVDVVFDKREASLFMQQLKNIGQDAALLKKVKTVDGVSEVILTARTQAGAEIKPVVGHVSGDNSISRMKDNMHVSVVPALDIDARDGGQLKLPLLNQRVLLPEIKVAPENSKASENRSARRDSLEAAL